MMKAVVAFPVDCPACGAKAGEHCRTMIDGYDMKWNHDARHDVYARWRNSRDAEGDGND